MLPPVRKEKGWHRGDDDDGWMVIFANIQTADDGTDESHYQVVQSSLLY